MSAWQLIDPQPTPGTKESAVTPCHEPTCAKQPELDAVKEWRKEENLYYMSREESWLKKSWFIKIRMKRKEKDEKRVTQETVTLEDFLPDLA